jgi:hypothetical protein
VLKSAQTAARFVFAILLSGAIINIFPTLAQQRPAAAPAQQQIAERLGKDDGYALAIHYSGDLHGSLETCG